MQQDLDPAVTDLQLAYHRSTFARYEILLPNIHYLHNEMDLFGFRKSGFSDEIEIKLSKSDFRADFNKTTYVRSDKKDFWGDYRDKKVVPKHEAIKNGLYPCNYFSFLMPEKLADQCEIPDHAGLYVFKGWDGKTGYVYEIIKAPRLHGRKINDEAKYEIAKKAVYKVWPLMEVINE